MEREEAILTYLIGTIGQMLTTALIVCFLRTCGFKVDYTTTLGIIFITFAGLSSCFWGIFVTVKYRNTSLKKIAKDFVSINQSRCCYMLVVIFLILEFGYLFVGGELKITKWYMLIAIFLRTVIFGGLEEVGWRYTLQPIIEEKRNYILATILTYVAWMFWNVFYFYVEGIVYEIEIHSLLMVLLTNSFLLSAVYKESKNLSLCVATHAAINTIAQIFEGGHVHLAILCRLLVISLAIFLVNREKEKSTEVIKETY